MTRHTTATLSWSPADVGPWGDQNLWRLDGTTAQLVEGGSQLYWHVCIGDAEHVSGRPIKSVPVENASDEFVARSVVMLAVVLFGDENELRILDELHNLVQTDAGVEIAPYWDLSDRDAKWFASSLGGRVKLAVTVFDEFSSLSRGACAQIEALGMRIHRFEPVLYGD